MSKASTVPPGKKWPMRARAHHHVHADGGARARAPAAALSIGAATWPTSRMNDRPLLLGLLADGEAGHELRPVSPARRTIGVRSAVSSTGETAKMSTVMKPDFRNVLA